MKNELLNKPFEKISINELEGHSKGTLMSITNLISYLVDWDELVIKWNEKKENNEAVDFPETGYKWSELGKLAQKFYEDFKDDDFNSLIIKLDKTVETILLLIENKFNKELYEVTWYEKCIFGRMIQFNT